MKAATRQRPTKSTQIIVDPKIDQLFVGGPLFPDKVKLAEEQLRLYGLPKELLKK